VKSSPAPLLPAHSPRWGARARLTARSRALSRGVTLVEVLIASLVLTITCGGILAMMIQSRRLTEGSIVQNSINTVMQGYIEQIKSMEYGLLVPSSASEPATAKTIPTLADATNTAGLTLSWGTPPNPLPAIGVVPTGAVTNSKTILIKTPLNPDGTQALLADGSPDLSRSNPSEQINLVVWIWVQDLTDISATSYVGPSKAVTMIYTYQFRDGGRLKSIRNSLRTIRSVVPSF